MDLCNAMQVDTPCNEMGEEDMSNQFKVYLVVVTVICVWIILGVVMIYA
jgi:hypothetical protein